MAASLLVGNKVAFAEEGDDIAAESTPIESTNATLPAQQTDEPPLEAELSTEEETVSPVLVETILDAGVYGADQVTGTTQPNAYVVVCAGESNIGEQAVDDTGIISVTLANVPEGTTVLQVKVYKDATQTFFLSEIDWPVPVGAEDPQAIPSEPFSPAGEETQPELVTDDSSTEPIGATEPASADTEETDQAPMLTAATVTSTAPVVEEAKGTWYYYVQSGDTLLKIATHCSTDVTNLMRWNNLTSSLIDVGQLLSVNGTNAYAEIDKETRTFATTAEFVNYLGQYATEIGNDYNLYASVMVAQASLETAYGTSKLSTVGNNLFGIKGDYAGNSIVMRTWEEESDGSIIWIDAFFRLYPSYYESMIDYAEKLRNGVSWDPNYYQGTWKENTTSYQDATSYLTGRYATDSSYYIKLNAIISAYDLTKFDGPKTVAVNYNALVAGTDFSIDSLPWGTLGYKYLEPCSNYYGKEVAVTKQTVDGQYALISCAGKELGWIDMDALKTFYTVPASYTLPIMNSGYSIDSLPWGEPGYVKIADASVYFGKLATVLRESANGAYAEIAIDGQRIGWIDKRAFSNARQVSYYAGVSGQNYSIDSLPWGTAGYQYLESTNGYLGSLVKVVAESTDGNYKLIQLNGQNLGWVDYRALAALNTKAVNYAATIRSVGYSIDSLPWGTPGFTMLGLTSSYLNAAVQVIQESMDGYYALVTLNGKALGWVDKRCF